MSGDGCDALHVEVELLREHVVRLCLALKILLRKVFGSNLDTKCFAEDLSVLARREILANEMNVVFA